MNAPICVNEDTIAAIATAPGEAGIAIIRVSGNGSLAIADRIFRAATPPPSEFMGNSFRRGHVRNPSDGSTDIDEVILLVYRAPHSYTRENVVEIQGHGGPACGRRILKAALDAGARLAEPGEFTRRAFLNGRIDLLQAEAVLDLIRAQSDRAAIAAVEQLEGHLSCVFAGVYDDMLSVASDLESTLDFPEDELPATVMNALGERLADVKRRIGQLLATWDEGRLLREGARVVISGKPNVGKSTLLNVLLGSARAIVTHVPGTTRDIIEEGLIIAGFPVRLIDTAGLREATCVVEREGVRRAQASIANADILLHVIDASRPLDDKDHASLESMSPDRTILVLNKTDLGDRVDRTMLKHFTALTACLIREEGQDEIRAVLLEKLGLNPSVAPCAVISERHRNIVQFALNELNDAAELLATRRDEVTVLAASRLRSALEELDKATGRVYSNELLDHIFRQFCIGK